MANLQYIGARYVPKLFTNPDDNSNDWKSGIGYEPLTIVTYLDDSYTSKMTVPGTVGNPADNPTYWVKTGNYNAAITNMQNELTIIKGIAEELKNDVDGIHFHFPALHYVSGETDGVGNCCIIEYNGKYYMVDCFGSYPMTHFGLPYLAALGVDRIEKVFITHYHGDHCDGLSPLVDSAIEIGEVILAPEPDWSQTSFWTAAADDPQPNYNAVIAKLTGAGVPFSYADGSTISLNDDLKVYPYNTNYSYYYSMTTARPAGNTTNDSDEGIYADYNNLSVIYCFVKGDRRAYFLSDINYTAGQRNKANFKKASLITIPHHDHDTFVDTEIMKIFNPEVAATQDTGNEVFGDIYGFIKRKAGKYLNAIGTKALITFGSNIILKVNASGGDVVLGPNHHGYYDFTLTAKESTEWRLSESELYAAEYVVIDADTLESGTVRAGGASTHTPIPGSGFMITTIMTNAGVKCQIAVENDVNGRFYFRTAGNNGPYTEWQNFRYDYLWRGTDIESGDDLNDYKTPGIYTCQNATVAASLSNSPLNNMGFRLEVIAVAGGVRQRITGNTNSIIYYERGNASLSGWGAWYSCTFQ